MFLIWWHDGSVISPIASQQECSETNRNVKAFSFKSTISNEQKLFDPGFFLFYFYLTIYHKFPISSPETSPEKFNHVI